jgi:hypothetical protein
MCDDSLMGLRFRARFQSKLPFWADFSSLWPPNENHQLRLMKPYRWGRLLVHYLKTFLEILLFETLPSYLFERAISRLLVGRAHLCQPSARVNVSVALLKVLVIAMLLSIAFIDISYVIISLKSTLHLFHWIHLVYLTLLAIKYHLVCGANSHRFSHAQMLSSKLTVIIHGPLGCLLLSVTIPYRERKLIVRLINSLDLWIHVINVVLFRWSLFEGRFIWLMSFSKLQSCLKLCRFAQTFLTTKNLTFYDTFLSS